ncbi:RE1 [Symbiodinium sp. KB8]|nr:RE1 [Symbiodinium sp. KB8]
MVQLQNVVADLATARTAGASSGGSSAAPEVVRPGVTELMKLPPPTLEGALGFSDWLHAIKPSMSDLSDSSGECWQQVLRQAQEWYTGEYVPAGPVARVRLKPPASLVEKELKWNRVRHRMEHLILQSCPEGVRAELSSARVSGVLNIMCRLYTIYKPGGVSERAEALRQVQQPRSADSPIDAVMKLRTWRRWMTRLSDLGGTQPDAAVCIQALEGITAGVLKGLPSLSFRVNLVRASLHLDTQPSAVKVDEFYEHLLVEAKAPSNPSAEGSTPSNKDKECRFLHDWGQIPKAEKADRCMLCGGKGHRKDACTVVANGAMAKRDDGASSAKAARSDASPKAKMGDPGLRKVISEAATVLREAMSTSATAGESNSPAPTTGASAQAGEGSEAPPMAVAAKIQAQLQDLEARVLDGGATHVVLDDAAAEPRLRRVQAHLKAAEGMKFSDVLDAFVESGKGFTSPTPGYSILDQAQAPRQVDVPQVSAVGAGKAPQLPHEDTRPVSKPISDKDRERWRRHIAAHHIPFRKDCLKCVMAGALGLQHRRVKCPSMYALAFDLAGPFKERGKDDKGGGYKYVLVAGLRVPDIALPGGDVQEPTARGPHPASVEAGNNQTVRDDDEGSEVSWLNADLEPTAGVKHVSQHDEDSEQERESVGSWFEMPDIDGLPEPEEDGEPAQAEAELEEVPDEGKATELEGDLWEDALGVSDMSDEQFDTALSQMLFNGANKELMSKATMEWLQSKLIQPSFTQGDDPQANGLAERLVGAYLVAKNVRCVENLVDPEAELGDEAVLEADVPDDLPRASSGDPLPMPSRRVTGKRAVRAISLPSEVLAEDLRRHELFTPDHCGRLLELAFGGSDAASRRTHRGPMKLAVVLGAYGHGGLHGVTRASRVYPEVCRYLNEYLRRNLPPGQVNPKWSAVTVVVAPEVAVHRDVRNEPGSVNFVTQVTTRSMWIEGASQEGCEQACVDAKGKEHQGYRMPLTQEWAELCELDEEQFEARISRWQRVLGGADEDPDLDPVSASIPHHLLVATVFQNRDWRRDPDVFASGPVGPVHAARVLDFSDDGPPDESPFPDRMLMFSVHDLVRDAFEMVILRVVLTEEEPRGQGNPMQPVLQMPGPPPPEIRAVSTTVPMPCTGELRPDRLPFPLPNPTCIQVNPAKSLKEMTPQEEALLRKTEAATTKGLEDILSSLNEPLSVTHTASQEEVRANLEKWRPAIEKELRSLKEPGVLISHFGKEARALIAGTGTTVIPLKGVFTTKAPGGPQDGLYRRKCRLVGCGNQASHIDADSLYAAGAPAELVRASLVQACKHQWSAFTCDIRSAFTQTPIPPYAARRYMLRPPRWLVELGLAEPDEYYSLGKVLYGFKEAPAWWSEHRDSKLLTAAFLGCHLEQGTSDPSLWRIMKGEELKGYLVTYVDDFLILSDSVTAGGLHRWLLEEAGWETDGLSEAKPGEPVRFLGMQLERHEDGHFSLNQESYIDELVRAYQLKSSDKSKIACPKEVLMNEPESVPESDEATVKAAQKVAGEFQRADLLTKPLSAARLRFLRELLQLGDEEAAEATQEREVIPAVRAMQAAPASCMSALLMLLQVCACKGDEAETEEGTAAMPIDWPWELAVLTLLVVLSTLFVWEASGKEGQEATRQGGSSYRQRR